ncbi:putative major sperm protein (MSP) [Helianthus annuus]|nr:putative major sperm protein (MSP) [Helianthus annuus]
MNRKQVQSAIKIKNTNKFHVAFKFQTTAPRSCFMGPPGAILTPGKSIMATDLVAVEQIVQVVFLDVVLDNIV